MNTISIYLIQLTITVVACLLLAAYIRPVLKRVLIDLCGTEERAAFWTLFSNIMLVVLPAIFGMGFRPEMLDFENSFFDIAAQLRVNLLGFIMSLIAIGAAVSFFALVAPRQQKQ
jgi:hypothetical protein